MDTEKLQTFQTRSCSKSQKFRVRSDQLEWIEPLGEKAPTSIRRARGRDPQQRACVTTTCRRAGKVRSRGLADAQQRERRRRNSKSITCRRRAPVDEIAGFSSARAAGEPGAIDDDGAARRFVARPKGRVRARVVGRDTERAAADVAELDDFWSAMMRRRCSPESRRHAGLVLVSAR